MLFGQDAENKEKEHHEERRSGGFQRRTPSEHPLAQQFRRERRVSGSGDWRNKASGSRSGFNRDRKPRY